MLQHDSIALADATEVLLAVLVAALSTLEFSSATNFELLKLFAFFKPRYSHKFRRYEKTKGTSTKGEDVKSSVLCIKPY